MSFSASWDTTTKIVSGAVLALCLAIAVVTGSLVAELLLTLVFAAAYAWAPLGYEMEDGAVVVRRVIGNVRIPCRGIREIRPATADDFRGCIRLFGSGGLFGYYGLFRTSKLGKSTWYVTDRARSVVLKGDAGTMLVSPDDVDGFIAAARTSGAISAPAPPAIFTSLDAGSGRKSPAWLIVAVLAAVAGLVAAAMTYAPGPPAYSLTPQSLTIHDRFYPVTLNAASVDVPAVRVIDLNRDSEWRPVRRTNGFSNTHYHSGWFRVTGGEKVRMYRADGSRLVLLPPKGDGTAVLLETKDPETFISEVQTEWRR